MSLRYYDDERARHPGLDAAPLTATEAEVALRKLCRHFDVPVPHLRFTSGYRHSRAGLSRMTLNTDGLSWLTLVHEFAHTWDAHRRYSNNSGPGSPMREFAKDRRWHDKYHARLVDRAAAWIERAGHRTAIPARLEAVATRRAERERQAAQPPSAAQRIAHKQQLIDRLERRIARLTTQVKKHRRSIAAIEAHARRAK